MTSCRAVIGHLGQQVAPHARLELIAQHADVARVGRHEPGVREPLLRVEGLNIFVAAKNI